MARDERRPRFQIVAEDSSTPQSISSNVVGASSSLGQRCGSLRGSSVPTGTIQRRLASPLRKDDTHKSRSVNNSSLESISLSELVERGLLAECHAQRLQLQRQKDDKQEKLLVWEVCELVSQPDFCAWAAPVQDDADSESRLSECDAAKVVDTAQEQSRACTTGIDIPPSMSLDEAKKQSEQLEFHGHKFWNSLKGVVTMQALSGVRPKRTSESDSERDEHVSQSIRERRRLCQHQQQELDLKPVPIGKSQPPAWTSLRGYWDPNSCAGLGSHLNPQVQFRSAKRCLIKLEFLAPTVAAGVELELLVVRGGAIGARRLHWGDSVRPLTKAERNVGTVARLIASHRSGQQKAHIRGSGSKLTCQIELDPDDVFTLILACTAAASFKPPPSPADPDGDSPSESWKASKEKETLKQAIVELPPVEFELRYHVSGPLAAEPDLMLAPRPQRQQPLTQQEKWEKSGLNSLSEILGQTKDAIGEKEKEENASRPKVDIEKKPFVAKENLIRPLVFEEICLHHGIEKVVENASFDVRNVFRQSTIAEMQKELELFAADLPSIFRDAKSQRSVDASGRTAKCTKRACAGVNSPKRVTKPAQPALKKPGTMANIGLVSSRHARGFVPESPIAKPMKHTAFPDLTIQIDDAKECPKVAARLSKVMSPFQGQVKISHGALALGTGA